jgi:hypothetical protein
MGVPRQVAAELQLLDDLPGGEIDQPGRERRARNSPAPRHVKRDQTACALLTKPPMLRRSRFLGLLLRLSHKQSPLLTTHNQPKWPRELWRWR